MPEPKHNIEVHQQWVEKIQMEGRDLTPWEIDFIESISERLSVGKKLVSDKQEDILERIYVEKTPS